MEPQSAALAVYPASEVKNLLTGLQIEPLFGAEAETAIDNASPEDEDDHMHAADGDQLFDVIVQALEDVVLNPLFEHSVEKYFRMFCHLFDSADENRIDYTLRFEEYTALVEGQLNGRLQEIPGYNEAMLSSVLADHAGELVGDVIDLLISLGDFETFKQTMVAWRQQVEAEKSASGSGDSSQVVTQGAASAPAEGAAFSARTIQEWAAAFGTPTVGPLPAHPGYSPGMSPDLRGLQPTVIPLRH